MTPKDIAIFTLAQEGTQGKEVAQAYLDLLKKWDGLDDPSEETLKAMEWQIGGTKDSPVKTWGTTRAIYDAGIKEAKK